MSSTKELIVCAHLGVLVCPVPMNLICEWWWIVLVSISLSSHLTTIIMSLYTSCCLKIVASFQVENGVLGMNQVFPDVLSHISLLLVIEFVYHLLDLWLVSHWEWVSSLWPWLQSPSWRRELPCSPANYVFKLGASRIAAQQGWQKDIILVTKSHCLTLFQRICSILSLLLDARLSPLIMIWGFTALTSLVHHETTSKALAHVLPTLLFWRFFFILPTLSSF